MPARLCVLLIDKFDNQDCYGQDWFKIGSRLESDDVCMQELVTTCLLPMTMEGSSFPLEFPFAALYSGVNKSELERVNRAKWSHISRVI